MAVGVWSAKIYGYDLPWLLWDVGDWLFSVLLCRHLAPIALANDLFYRAIHCGETSTSLSVFAWFLSSPDASGDVFL